jgi:hypothetical protein
MRKNLSIFFLIVFSFGAASVVSAHEPRYVKDDQLVIIKNPDISQAFYGELKGGPAYYLIDLKKPQDLYFQILVPDLPEIQKDKIVTVEYLPELGVKPVIFSSLGPSPAVWQNFYEEYAGDNYFQGPSVKKPAEPGYYLVKVTSPDNTGKYVLVVGDKEEFPPLEMAKALITIPQLKKNFFQEPFSQWFNGKIGKYSGIGLLALLVVGYLFHKFHQVYK